MPGWIPHGGAVPLLGTASRNPAWPPAQAEEQSLEILRFLVLASRGGPNRARVLEALMECPRNAFDLSTELDLNYGTVTAHLRRLSQAGLVVSLNGGGYGHGYAVAPVVRRNRALLKPPPERR